MYIILYDTNEGQKEIICTAEQVERNKALIKLLYGEYSINTISTLQE